MNQSLKKTPLQSACAALLAHAPLSVSRRTFLQRSGAVATASVLAGLPGCGGGGGGGVSGDPIWGAGGPADIILQSLAGVSQSAFPAKDFLVTNYGAQPCTVVSASNPYTNAATSPLSTGR